MAYPPQKSPKHPVVRLPCDGPDSPVTTKANFADAFSKLEAKHGREVVKLVTEALRPPICTTTKGDNADLIAKAEWMYLHRGDRIADVTYGKGAFWRKVDLTQYDFHPSGFGTSTPYDFRNLPYNDDTFDVVVLDPPYRHNSSVNYPMDGNYRNHLTTGTLNHRGIVQLYRDGMVEGMRVLRPSGLLWVKTQDEIESGRQRLTHFEIIRDATQLELEVVDLFLLIQMRLPHIQRFPQRTARKSHSYLLIFQPKDGGRRH